MAQQHILQVSELTKKVRFLLESELNTVWLCGEISNFIAASSGHWYFSLKDSKSQVKCAMFKGSNNRARITASKQPRNGLQVLVRAKVSLYEPRGDFQLIIEQMDDAGEGLLRQKFEQLKNKLADEGVFSTQFKKSLPTHAETVGLITSATGAAVKDILTVLKRRNPLINIIIYPSLVQGDLAKHDIVTAIEIANLRNECDVLILGRGGGSLEDLWCFNEEIVVRAIYQSALPIISAVGHEVDTTLSDYVADLRAPTPSAAAELVSQDNSEVIKHINLLQNRLITQIQRLASSKKVYQINLLHRLSRVHPVQQLQDQQQKVDELNLRLQQTIKRMLQQNVLKNKQISKQLLQLSPSKFIQQQMVAKQNFKVRLISAMKRIYHHNTAEFAHVIEQLQLISPLATIARGYSIARDKQGNIISSVETLRVGDNIDIQIKDGKLQTKITAIL